MFNSVKGLCKTVFCVLALASAAVQAKPKGMDKESVDWLLLQITLGEAKQDPALISNSLDRLLQIAPGDLSVRVAHARIVLANNEMAKAQSLYQQIERDFPEQLETKQLKLLIDLKQDSAAKELYVQAKLAARAGNIQQAISGYQAVFKHGFPTPFYEFEYYALLGRDDGTYEKAKTGIASLIARFPGVIDFEIQKARLILAKQPEDKKALESLARYSNESKYKEEIAALWLSALANHPFAKSTQKKYQVFLKAYPDSQQGKGQYETFLKDYADHRKRMADPAYQAYLAGAAALAKDESAEGFRYLTKAIAARPNDPNVIGEMGRALLQLGQHWEAKSHFERAAKKAQFLEKYRWQALTTTAHFWGLIAQVSEHLAAKDIEQAKTTLAKAKALGQDEDTVSYYTAEIKLAEGDKQHAFRLYQQLLRSNPSNEPALRGIVKFVKDGQSLAALDNLSALLTREQNQLVAQDFIAARLEIAKSLAQAKADRGEYHEALQLLASTPVGDVLDPWFYFLQAKIWREAGSVKQGIRVFKEITWQYPLHSELRYAQALYLSSIDESEQALAALQSIPLNGRSEQVQLLEQELNVESEIQLAVQARDANDSEKALAILNKLDTNELSSANLKARIAALWYSLGEQNNGISLLSQAIKQDPTLVPYWHLQLGEWLLAKKDKEQLEQWVAKTSQVEMSSQEESLQFSRMKLEYQLLTSDSVRATLEQLAMEQPNSAEVYTRLISLDLEENAFDQAAQRLNQVHQRIELSKQAEFILLEKAIQKKHTPLIEYLGSHLVRRSGIGDGDFLKQLMPMLFSFQDGEKAIELASDLVLLSSFDSELVKQAGDLAEQWGKNTLAADYYQRVVRTYNEPADDEAWYVDAARRGFVRMQQKTDGHIAIAGDFSGQTSTQSDSTLGLGASLLESYFPLWSGHGFVKLDNISVLAQSTDFTASFDSGRYGTGYLCYPQCLLEKITPADHGVAFGLGWQNEQWRVDIGTTPKGFLLDDWVGGILYQSSFDDVSYDVELRRRALTNSLLSFAGMEDVTLDKRWGGVIQQGLTLGAYYDLGLDYGFWSTLDYHQFSGLNVKDNDRLRAMGGGYYRLYQANDLELSVGTNLMYWGYAYNLSEETFGHGGYYSPQSYYGVSVPVTLDGVWRDKLVYRVKLGVGYSVSETEAIDFFPNNPELQQQAWQLVEERSEEPVFLGSKDKGVSYNVQGIAEYHFEQHWILGLSLSLDRAELYEPNYAQLYLKYKFNPIIRPLSLGPRPIIPYVNF